MKENRFLVPTADTALSETLDSFTAAEFEQIVLANAAAPKRNTAIWEALLSTQCVERTRSALADAYQRNSAAMADRRAEEELGSTSESETAAAAAADYHAWRRRATSFNHLVQGALREVNERRQQLVREQDLSAAEQYRQKIRDVALAIAEHEHAVRSGGIAPNPHDLKLWECLDAVQLPHGPESTLTSLRELAATVWYPSVV